MSVEQDDPPVQCWHYEPGSPCDWDVCRQPERLAAGDTGTDPATEASSTPEPCSDGLGRLYPFPHWHPHNGEGTCVRCGQAVDPARQPVAHGYETRPVAVDPLPRPRSEHCRPGRCMALTCCSYECSQGRCPSIPAEHRKPTP